MKVLSSFLWGSEMTRVRGAEMQAGARGPGGHPVIRDSQLYTIRRAFFKEKNDQCQIRYESECLFRIRKEIQTDYKFINYDK